MGSTLEAVRMQRYRYALLHGGESTAYYSSGQQHGWAVGSITSVFLLTLLSLASMSAPPPPSSSSSSSASPPSSWWSRLLRPLAPGTKSELVLILAASSLSVASVVTATNPATGLAMNASGGIGFGNLYYSTWIVLVACLGLLVSYVRTERGIDLHGELASRGRRFRCWAALAAAGVVIMGSAASCYDARCHYNRADEGEGDGGGDGGDGPNAYCRRSAFGVAAGITGCAVGLAIVATRLACSTGSGGDGRIVFVAECLSGLCLLILHCFAVAYLTGEEGPGAPLGNLYYSTWAAFGLALYVAASCLEEVRAAAGGGGGKGGRGDDGGRRFGAGADGSASDADVSSIAMSVRPSMDGFAPILSSEQRVDLRPGEDGPGGSTSSYANIGSIRSGSVGEVQVGI